jgi:hypothetical protein
MQSTWQVAVLSLCLGVGVGYGASRFAGGSRMSSLQDVVLEPEPGQIGVSAASLPRTPPPPTASERISERIEERQSTEAVRPDPDPCEALMRQLQATEDELMRLRVDLVLQSSLLDEELLRTEATDSERRKVSATLSEFPVDVRTGEVAWLVESYRTDDWKMYGELYEEALLVYLGADRVLAVLPAERVDELRLEYGMRSWWPTGR